MEIENTFTNLLSKEIYETTYKYGNEKIYQDTIERMAKAASLVEEKNKQNQFYNKFKFLLEDFKFTPGGRTIANLGISDRDGTTLYNCFINVTTDVGIEDPDSITGIYDMLTRQAHTLKSEGGYGTNFSWIRPKGNFIYGIGVRTPGTLKFMELWDKSSEIITAGSETKNDSNKKGEKIKIRKGAQMAVLDIWHPEIEDYIVAKQTPGRLTKFNMSVGITEGFIKAVQNDKDWDLIFPDTKHPKYKKEWKGDIEDWKEKGYEVVTHKTIKAKDLWNKILKSTYNRAEPGVLFLDLANKLNPIGYCEKIRSSNPCQPSWAKLLTKNGIIQLKDVKIGDEIWSKEGWTKIINKWDTGVKKVYEYRTTAGCFYGTENHKIVSNGQKIEAFSAESIDIIKGKCDYEITLYPPDIMDGLVFGDGSVHKASNNLVYLCVGENDQDYLNSEIKSLFYTDRPGLCDYAYEVETSIQPNEIPHTYNRVIPDRFYYGDRDKVCGFLRGLYSANGSVCGGRITLKASSFRVIEQVQTMLSSVGIRSYYTTNKATKVKFSNGEYLCKQSYDLNITVDKGRFEACIGFIQEYKQRKLDDLLKNYDDTKRGKETYDIISVNLISEEEVFDITVDNKSHTYWTQCCDVSNCGEIPNSTGVCNLGSINLAKCIKFNNGVPEFDFELFLELVKFGIRFLDNVNDISTAPLPEYTKAAKEKRRIGLGTFGLGSLHYILGIKFGSEESLLLIKKIYKLKAETEILYDAQLGKEKGSFPLFDKNKYFDSYWWKHLKISQDIKDQVEKIGFMRNSHRSMNAPTGNTSVLCNNVSSGIEPVFMKEYVRWVIVPESERNDLRKSGFKFCDFANGEWKESEHMKFTMRGDEQILKGNFNNESYEIDKNRGLVRANNIEDYGWRLAKEIHKDNLLKLEKCGVFCTTNDLTVDDHLNTLSIISNYTDQACSKTVNVPNNFSFENFSQVYLQAWEKGIKGITTYRDGTMTAVLEGKSKDDTIKESHAPKRPKSLKCDIHFSVSDKEQYYVIVGKLDNLPFEIFTGLNHYRNNNVVPNSLKEGELVKESKGKYILYSGSHKIELSNGHSNHNCDALARLTSCGLRHGVPLPFISDQLLKNEGDMFIFSKVIARVLKKYIKDGTKSTNECPECKSKSLVYRDSCCQCSQCGFSRCT